MEQPDQYDGPGRPRGSTGVTLSFRRLGPNSGSRILPRRLRSGKKEIIWLFRVS